MPKDRGPCRWEVKRGEECGQPATTQVLMRDQVGSAYVPVCDQHKAEYNRKAASIRVG